MSWFKNKWGYKKRTYHSACHIAAANKYCYHWIVGTWVRESWIQQIPVKTVALVLKDYSKLTFPLGH